MGFDETTLHSQLQGLPVPAGWCVAFSGGLDSTVLLHAMARLRLALGAPLRAVHVHHGLLPHADDWTRHCRSVCERLDVPLEVIRLALRPSPGESLEAVARAARYRAIEAIQQADEMLLLAQHQGDQAETLLLQLLRGSGIRGLAGMPRCRRWGRGWQARPLLDFSRRELAEWAAAQRLEWIEDPSNQDLRFDRNFLRQRVIPLLQERWPAAERTMARSARLLAGSLEQLAATHARGLARCRRGRALSVTALQELAPAERSEVIRAWVREQGHEVPDRRRLRVIEEQVLCAGPDGEPRVDWGGVSLRRYRDRLCLVPRDLPEPPTEERCWSGGDTLRLPCGLGRLRRVPAAGGIPEHCWREGGVQVRWQVPAAGCRLPGRVGTRSLRKICQEAGVPVWARYWLPLLYHGEHLLAVAGLCRCEGPPARHDEEPTYQVLWEGRPSWLESGFREETDDGVP